MVRGGLKECHPGVPAYQKRHASAHDYFRTCQVREDGDAHDLVGGESGPPAPRPGRGRVLAEPFEDKKDGTLRRQTHQSRLYGERGEGSLKIHPHPGRNRQQRGWCCWLGQGRHGRGLLCVLVGWQLAVSAAPNINFGTQWRQ
jgi:hypothetical protein